MKSTFTSDLGKEKRLSELLDTYYSKWLKHYDFERVQSLQDQLRGVDVIFKHRKTQETFLVDEKAQLDYINEDLPTFAFELHYLKNGVLKEGWLFDSAKKTDFYALVTAIYEDEPAKYTSCKVTFVNRSKLVSFLEAKGVSKNSLMNYYQNGSVPHGKLEVQELDPRTAGYLYHSKNNKAEQPFNLVLKLDFLVTNRIAKVLV
ncbi:MULTISPECIES: hypothetical protein [Maribacter]|uniref:Uncharacterized protein n=1 Tax=Maribacter flavus TaxID=1658664 RepID=A0ABU7IEJ9_9FLAO|nr:MULTISPECIES: hypothetical protein [Maribacter]MDC6404231.1 hypothetical protein [Maribacter sp. PR66]MEE1971374.1 hypothetical protein [Maribacter flavus]